MKRISNVVKRPEYITVWVAAEEAARNESANIKCRLEFFKWNELINKWFDCSRRFFICVEAYTLCAHSDANLARKRILVWQKSDTFFMCSQLAMMRVCIFTKDGEGGVHSGVKYLIYICDRATSDPWERIVRSATIFWQTRRERERETRTQPTRSQRKNFYWRVSLISIFLSALWPLFSHIN
jgi:hypothetical protein